MCRTKMTNKTPRKMLRRLLRKCRLVITTIQATNLPTADNVRSPLRRYQLATNVVVLFY